MTSHYLHTGKKPLPPANKAIDPGKIDGRTKVAKRAKAIEADLLSSLSDGANAWQRQACRHAAFLTLCAEQLAVRHATGDPAVCADDVSRMASSARRAVVDAIGIKPRDPNAATPVSIADVLSAKYGQPEPVESRDDAWGKP